MTATPPATLAEARSIAPHLPFALMAPRYQFTSAAAEPNLLHRYDIRGPGGRLNPSYVIVIDRGGLGEYYDVQGTTWTDPPLLSGPSATVRAGSRTYGLYYDGEHIKTVAWHEDGAAYWIENSLNNGLSPHDIVALAQETRPVAAPASTAPGLRSAAGAFVLPTRSTTTAGLTEDAGAGTAIIVLLTLGGLAVFVIRRQRELRKLREQVARALTLEARQRSALAAAGMSTASIQPAPGAPAVPPAPPTR
jgi:hypothetical protein